MAPRIFSTLGCSLACLLAAGSSFAQTLRTGVNLVLVPVSVTDHRGASITGLTPENFTLFDDKDPRPIVSFSGEDVPCSVGVVLDISGSMRDRIDMVKDSARRLLHAAGAEDEMFLMAVSSRPETLSGFRNEAASLYDSLRSVSAGGWTALTDAVLAGIGSMRSAQQQRRAIVVISDGIDNHSRKSLSELLRVAQEADVQVYTVGITDWNGLRKPIELTEQRAGLVALQQIAERSGGLFIEVSRPNGVAPAMERIGHAMHNQYVLGFYPGKTPHGKWRKLHVKLAVQGATVNARSGYYAP